MTNDKQVGIVGMIGNTFGRWKVIEEIKVNQNSSAIYKYYNCKCECGTIKPVRSVNLKNGRSSQCSECSKKERYINTEEMIGKIYGKWLVKQVVIYVPREERKIFCREFKIVGNERIYKDEELLLHISASKKPTARYVLCQCECGRELKIAASRLKLGRTRQCNRCNITKHGMNNEPTYITWRSMKSRCNSETNSNYKYYGARGIKICDRWHTFSGFLLDMGFRPEGKQLDRIDNNGNYEKENCRWVTPKENSNNRKR
jgi:hypothetical protein